MKLTFLKPHLILLLTIISLACTQSLFASQNRIALVIGNSNYHDSPLKNPVNDAKAISSKLKNLGFKVILRIDSDQQAMEEAIGEFGRKLEKQGGVGLFFYAGHGIQSKGQNYLIPVNTRLKRETELRFKAVNAAQVLEEMGYASNGLNIVILDACRNNPLTRSFRSAKRGLARIDNAPSGLLLAYSTAPGEVAADGDGKNSPYTQELIRAMGNNGWSLEKVFKEAAKGVKTETRGQQIPWVSSSITGDFFFSGQEQDKENGISTQIITASADPDMASKHESRFWDDVNSSPSKEMFEAYIDQYPNGHYVRIAKIKLKQFSNKFENTADKQLKVCASHLIANRLTSGQGGNAFSCYEQILLKEPKNHQALEGISKIENKYVDWAETQIKKGNLSKADNYINKVKFINSESENLIDSYDLRKKKQYQLEQIQTKRHNQQRVQIQSDEIARLKQQIKEQDNNQRASETISKKTGTMTSSALAGSVIFKRCAACHGAKGEKKALGKSGVINTKSKSEIIRSLTQYKAGTRNVYGMGAIMKGQIARYNGQQINRLADYISQLNNTNTLIENKNHKIEVSAKQIEFKSRHILLKTEKMAISIINKLIAGADFSELAKKYSVGPSASRGGAIGWAKLGAMVEPYEKAAINLPKGTYSFAPVKTQFGYHVIFLEDLR